MIARRVSGGNLRNAGNATMWPAIAEPNQKMRGCAATAARLEPTACPSARREAPPGRAVWLSGGDADGSGRGDAIDPQGADGSHVRLTLGTRRRQPAGSAHFPGLGLELVQRAGPRDRLVAIDVEVLLVHFVSPPRSESPQLGLLSSRDGPRPRMAACVERPCSAQPRPL